MVHGLGTCDGPVGGPGGQKKKGWVADSPSDAQRGFSPTGPRQAGACRRWTSLQTVHHNPWGVAEIHLSCAGQEVR